jgi:hypothetical protein
LYREAQAALARFSSSPRAAARAKAVDHRDWSAGFGAGRLAFGQYPAKWTFDPFAPVTIANCNSDFVVFGLNVAGSVGVAGTQANLIGLNSLYSSQQPGPTPLCGASPTYLFAYNITTIPNGRILTSPVLSLDGTKVAFMETSTVAGTRQTVMHVVNIPASNPSPLFPQGSSAASPVVPAGMVSVNISAAQSARSSPWVDYATDTMYVATDDGRLHKISPVFNNPPVPETSPWPLLVNPGSVFTRPVFDDVTHNVFLGEGTGRVYVVNVISQSVTPIVVGALGSTNPRVLDSPIVDSTAGTFLATTSNDGTSAAVVQYHTSSPFTLIARARIGKGSTGAPGTVVNLYGGDFDNTYFSTPATGHMIVCGTGAADTIPTIYSLSFDSSAHLQSTATPVGAVSSSGTARCGPVTEFFNSNWESPTIALWVLRR